MSSESREIFVNKRIQFADISIDRDIHIVYNDGVVRQGVPSHYTSQLGECYGKVYCYELCYGSCGV